VKANASVIETDIVSAQELASVCEKESVEMARTPTTRVVFSGVPVTAVVGRLEQEEGQRG
jgi:hypothetical protein